MHEVNTFVPTKTTLDTFRAYYLLFGDELFSGFQGARVEIPAFIEVLSAAGVEVVPLLAGTAAAGGPLARSDFDWLLNDLIVRLRAALPVDAVLLALHGAMAVEDDPDAEGAILEAVRAVVGPDLPVGVSLDLHGHITPGMVSRATYMVGYQEYPHTDIYETGVRTARLMLETLAGRRRPVMALAKRPMVVSAVGARTTEGPLSRVAARARALEADGTVLHASLFPVQPWMDVPDLGFAALVVADGDHQTAERVANELAGMAWDARAEFEPDLMPLDDAIKLALEAPDGLTVVGDAGDAPSGGSAADNAAVLRALLALGADRAARTTYVTLCDAEAAQAAASAGIGNAVTLAVGHKVSTSDGQPVTVRGRVRTLSDGVYRLKAGGATGLIMHNGLTAVIEIGSILLCLRSLPAFEWDPALYTSVGLDLNDAALVFVKSPGHFRTSFGPLAARVLTADTPGPTCANMRRVNFTRVTRPLYPLDEI